MVPYYTRSHQKLIDTRPVYNTRLQKHLRQLIHHNIDFDESSRLWKHNKVRNGQSYVYISEKEYIKK